jgi:hypothetical protein
MPLTAPISGAQNSDLDVIGNEVPNELLEPDVRLSPMLDVLWTEVESYMVCRIFPC